MSYSIYKNKKLLKDLSEKNYRLLKFNKVLNPFHTYLMYSLIPYELNELNLKDLNSVVEIFKKNINKFVKKKFNKNYVNANNEKDLEIFAELCDLNISIFNNNFNNLDLSTKNKKYTKRLYLINRDNELSLLIKKDKKGSKLKLGNNVLKAIQSGGVGIKRKAPQSETLPPMFLDNYYNSNKVNDFLRIYCEKLITKGKETDELQKKMEDMGKKTGEYNSLKKERGKLNKEKLEHFKEIIIAAFTDNMRNEILSSIKRIEAYINNNMVISGKKGNPSINGFIKETDDVREKYPVRLVISGGSGFNNLIEKENRPVSPDIDVKLCLYTNEAITLHKYMTKNSEIKDLENTQKKVAKQLLIVRTHLFDAMKEESERLNKLIFSDVKKFNDMFKNLYKYCSLNLMNGQDIPFLNTLDDTADENWKKEFKENQPVKVLVRETLMKRGIDGDPKENNPYKLHDVFLYSLDLPFNEKTGFDSLAGILDIVVSIPGHIGYILPSQYTNKYGLDKLKEDTKGCYNITVDYYTEELNKLLKYGLRTKNEKILKDLVRYKILLISQNKIASDDITKTVTNIYNSLDNDDFKYAIQLRMDVLNDLKQDSLQELSSENLIFDSQDSTDLDNSNEHFDNLKEHCYEDNKMSEMYIDIYSYINEHGSLKRFADDCVYHGDCSYGGGSKKKKQIGGTPCGNVEMLSMSKVFQLMVNDKSMTNFGEKLNNIKSAPDNNETHLKELIKGVKFSTPTINFEKLTEVKENKKEYPNNVNNHLDNYTDEYLSTKASIRVVPFRMSKNNKFLIDITNICNHLIGVILNGNINKLCYCYESEFYKPGVPNVPTEEQYASFLLTQCQVLERYTETKNLYYEIKRRSIQGKGTRDS